MKILKKLLGLDKLEQNLQVAQEQLTKVLEEKNRIDDEIQKAQRQEELAKMSPKERATRVKEPWVGVLDTHVNKDNIRNGFFELDWNEYFVLKLKQEGYGADGDLDEEIIDRWFRELCANVVVDGDYGGPVNTGVIDIQSVKRNNK